MDLITSVFTICSTVNDTDREYKILASKLAYQLKKANHLMNNTEKMKIVPQFIAENLINRYDEAKIHLQKLQKLLKQNSLPFKEKIKLSLPFNKTNKQVKLALQQLEKAQQQISNFSQDETEDNGKRIITRTKFVEKKQSGPLSVSNDQINDRDIDEMVMGPTIQQDAAIEFTKNKYIMVNVEIKGQSKLIEVIENMDKSLKIFNRKIPIKFQKPTQLIQQIELFSLGRVYFKPIYSKFKFEYPDIDRISKNNHFIIKLIRRKEAVGIFSKPSQQGHQHDEQRSSQKQPSDQFFSFPQTQQACTFKQTDSIMVESDKTIYWLDCTGVWKKLQTSSRQLCKGDEIATFLSPDTTPQSPRIYFKISYDFLN